MGCAKDLLEEYPTPTGDCFSPAPQVRHASTVERSQRKLSVAPAGLSLEGMRSKLPIVWSQGIRTV